MGWRPCCHNARSSVTGLADSTQKMPGPEVWWLGGLPAEMVLAEVLAGLPDYRPNYGAWQAAVCHQQAGAYRQAWPCTFTIGMRGPEWAVAAEPLSEDGARACGRPAISPLRELGYSASVPAPLPPTHVRRRYSSDPLAPAGKAGAFFALAAALCSAGIRLTPPRTMTYFKPKNMGDVRLLLGSLDDDVAVTLTPGVQLPPTVRTVGDLRRLTAWPIKHRLVVERAPFVKVRVERGRAVHHA